MPADKFCAKCGVFHKPPAGEKCCGPILGDLTDRTRRSGFRATGPPIHTGVDPGVDKDSTMAEAELQEIPIHAG